MTSETDWQAIRSLMEAMLEGLEAIDKVIKEDTERQYSLHGPLKPGNVMDLIMSCQTMATNLRYAVVQTANYSEKSKHLRNDLRTIFMTVADAASELIGYEATRADDGLPTAAAIRTEMNAAGVAKFLKSMVPRALSEISETKASQGAMILSGNA
jgi:hypothetical protein